MEVEDVFVFASVGGEGLNLDICLVEDVVEFLGLGLIDAKGAEAFFEGERLIHQEADLAFDDVEAVIEFFELRVGLEMFQFLIAVGDQGFDRLHEWVGTVDRAIVFEDGIEQGVELGSDLSVMDDNFLSEFRGDLSFLGCLEGEGEFQIAGGLDQEEGVNGAIGLSDGGFRGACGGLGGGVGATGQREETHEHARD